MISKGFSQAFLDELITKNDIVSVISKYVTLTRRGANFWACCPFHMEKTPSMSVKEDGQFFKCFGCGGGGNVINFVKQIENVDFYKAVEILAENAGMQLPTYEDNEEMQKKKHQRDTILSILKATSDFYISNLNKVEANKHIDYIRSRGITDAMVKKFNYNNVNQVPKLVKITINSGLGAIKDNSKSVQLAQKELELISGQKPVLTLAKKSVANFKVREGQGVGMKVTLRGTRMYEFFDKFISIALPRVRDFRGVSKKSFDGRGNYSMGVKEQLIFPEISYDQVETVRGFDICITTTANTDEEARELLTLLGMPFANK
ncbi:MAG: 50S ribosomal protein L5 [Clostridia bacterium]|nr:50S ribosomal protein L5 [Clostridia bacterium]